MTGFIPDLQTRVTVNIHLEELDNAKALLESNPYLSQIPSFINWINDTENKLNAKKQPLTEAIAKRLQSNQENIISTKHYITGKMVNSVELMSDGDDYLVGNTATSIDGFPYPLAIEKGRRGGYEVRPVNAKALHWVSKSGEEVVAKVSHPKAYAGDPFVEHSINQTVADIEEIVNEHIKGI